MRFKMDAAGTVLLLSMALIILGAVAAGAQIIHDYNFDNGDPQGWTGVDVTQQPLHFNLQSYGGSDVLWCGEYFGPDGASNPGYGNGWGQYLTKEFALSAGATLDYVIQYDTEHDWDFVYVEVSTDGGDSYTELARHTGNSYGFGTHSADLSAYGGLTVTLRFRFSSDGGYSDEDGMIDTDGAYRLDEVRVTGFPDDTFDAGYSGWNASSYGLGGEFRLVETPECSLGNPCGPAVWPYTWSWVAYDTDTGLFPFGPGPNGGYQMAMESPTIPITPPIEGATYKVEYNIHIDLPFGCGVFHRMWVAAPAPEDGGTWVPYPYHVYGSSNDQRRTFNIDPNAMAPDATSMRVRLGAVAVWYWGGSPPYTTAAPFFDNISIVEEGVAVEPGAVAGSVTTSDPTAGTPMYGVTVSAYDTAGELVGITSTDEAGAYEILELEPGDHTISVVAPLGFSGPTEASAAVLSGQTTTIDFEFSQEAMVFCPRTIGYWKHQLKKASPDDKLTKAISDKKIKDGAPIEETSPVCDYLDLVAAHFNGNLVNEVAIYVPPASGECGDKLVVAGELLNLHGAQEMEARARQQLMAVLLNTASGCLPLNGVISDDGMVVSQAITFCDNQIDAGTNLELAKDIADYINNGWPVPAGWIPDTTPIIFYDHDIGIRPVGPFLAQNHPNPFRSATSISFRMPEAGEYTLTVYDVAGRMVRRYAGSGNAGEIVVSWNGRDGAGQSVAPGIYYYRLTSPGFAATRKALVMH